MHRGYVKLWRKSLDSGMIQNHRLWAFWTWCLMKASHCDRSAMVGFQEVDLKPGQFVFGRKIAASELGMSEQSIRTCLAKLKATRNLTVKATNKFSIITVVNWDIYQQEEPKPNQQNRRPVTNQQPTRNHQTTIKQPTSNQQVTTDKNDKHLENGKNVEHWEKEACSPKPPASPPIPYQAIVDAYHEELPELPRVRTLGSLKPKLAARWKESAEYRSVDWWRQEFFRGLVAGSDFLCGRVKPWKANLGWMIGPENFAKILNGQYQNNGRGGNGSASVVPHSPDIVALPDGRTVSRAAYNTHLAGQRVLERMYGQNSDRSDASD